jgi:hypothetical protein
MEGKERMKQVECAQENQAETAKVLRLCRHWHSSTRVGIADSAFRSVQTLRAIFRNLGLFPMGAVKTND